MKNLDLTLPNGTFPFYFSPICVRIINLMLENNTQHSQINGRNLKKEISFTFIPPSFCVYSVT